MSCHNAGYLAPGRLVCVCFPTTTISSTLLNISERYYLVQLLFGYKFVTSVIINIVEFLGVFGYLSQLTVTQHLYIIECLTSSMVFLFQIRFRSCRFFPIVYLIVGIQECVLFSPLAVGVFFSGIMKLCLCRQ